MESFICSILLKLNSLLNLKLNNDLTHEHCVIIAVKSIYNNVIIIGYLLQTVDGEVIVEVSDGNTTVTSPVNFIYNSTITPIITQITGTHLDTGISVTPNISRMVDAVALVSGIYLKDIRK